MSSLSPESRALLDAYRNVSEFDDRPDDALLQRLEASTERRVEPPRRVAAWVVASIAVASTVTAALAWPRIEFVALHGTAPVAEAVDAARETAPVPRPRAVPPNPAPEAEAPAAPASRPAPAPSRPRALPPADTPPAETDLVAELAVLRKARVAMQKGDFEAAAEILEQHGRDFPTGQLREDRDALWVVLRCRKGARNDGRAAFEAAHPSSHHLVAIRSACDEEK